MKLLSATPSPYARKVRIALIEKGIAFELMTELPWNPYTAAPKFNPLGKIPVLVLDDGRVVHDSKVIVEYLEAQRTLVDLRQQYARSLFDAHAALLLLERAAGRNLGR